MVWPWAHRVAFQADFEAAPGISPGNGQEVRIAGVTVGEVSAARVTKEGRARLTLSLQERYGTVYGNARAYLRPKSPLNDMYVLLDPGLPPADRLRSGGVIPLSQTARPVEIDEVTAHLDERARNDLGVLLAETDTALAAAHAARIPGDLQATDSDASSPSARWWKPLQTRRERIARLVTALADVATAAGQDDARLAHLGGVGPHDPRRADGTGRRARRHRWPPCPASPPSSSEARRPSPASGRSSIPRSTASGPPPTACPAPSPPPPGSSTGSERPSTSPGRW